MSRLLVSDVTGFAYHSLDDVMGSRVSECGWCHGFIYRGGSEFVVCRYTWVRSGGSGKVLCLFKMGNICQKR